MTFKAKILSDNTVTPAGELACEMAYEYYTGECWHKFKDKSGDPAYPDWACIKCGKTRRNDNANNPPLATSLDAWRPIWEGISDEQHIIYHNQLLEVILKNAGRLRESMLTPHHHLEAALRAAGVECEKCDGKYYCKRFTPHCNDSINGWGSEWCMNECPKRVRAKCTCTNGRITLYDKWEEVE